MSLLKKLFSFGPSEEVVNALKEGAVVVDVRTPGEFSGGHFPGSKNIPLNTLGAKIAEIKSWKKPVIVVCASGMRSASAASQLKNEKIQVINGGGWSSLPKA
ncbi:MAG: rhodanese-like domain-containing protein [Cytophagaceae bacterium]|jgi:rhodanese-related sulfurtransferase|nr:rhodanese-like domain-containing protein [Cytophagaceae bacterium]